MRPDCRRAPHALTQVVSYAASTYLFALYLTLLAIGPAAYVFDRRADTARYIQLFCDRKCASELSLVRRPG